MKIISLLLFLFLITTSSYSQVYIENAIPKDAISYQKTYEEILREKYLNDSNLAYFIKKAENYTDASDSGSITKQLYDIQIILKEYLDAIPNISNSTLKKKYLGNVSTVINEVFRESNIKKVKGVFTPPIRNRGEMNVVRTKFKIGNELFDDNYLFTDVNGDGFDDFVSRFRENGETSFYVRFSRGDGSFGEEIITKTLDGEGTFLQEIGGVKVKHKIYSYDVNKDGYNDILYVFSDYQNGLKIRVRLSDGKGNFLPNKTYTLPLGEEVFAQNLNSINVIHSFYFLDVDNNGYEDFVCLYDNEKNPDNLMLSIFLSDENENFNEKKESKLGDGSVVFSQTINNTVLKHDFKFLDMNDDGFLDMVYAFYDINSVNRLKVRVRLNNQSGGFSELKKMNFDADVRVFVQMIDGLNRRNDIFFQDVNNDKYPDLIYVLLNKEGKLEVKVGLSNINDDTYNDTLKTLSFPEGSGSLVQNINGKKSKNQVYIFDINKDGNADIIYRYAVSETIAEIRIKFLKIENDVLSNTSEKVLDNISKNIDFSLPLHFPDLNANRKKDVINFTKNRITSYLSCLGTFNHLGNDKNGSVFVMNKNNGRYYMREKLLDNSQFMFLVARYLNVSKRNYKSDDNKAIILESFLNKWIIELPQITQSQWNNRVTYFTHKALLKYRENPVFSPVQETPFPSHTFAVTDIDLWIVASLVEYLAYEKGRDLITEERRKDYLNYLEDALKLINDRIEFPELRSNNIGERGFIFDRGKWKDHKDFKFGNYTGKFPLSDNIPAVDDITYDFGHAYRFIDVFESFYRNIRNIGLENLNDLEKPYDGQLMKNLANQVVYSIYDPLVNRDGTIPRFKNYFEGIYKGWYRVNYSSSSSGIKPYQNSGHFIKGGYARLGNYNADLRKLSIDIWNYRQNCLGQTTITDDNDVNYSKYFLPTSKDYGSGGKSLLVNDIALFSSFIKYKDNYRYVTKNNKIYIVKNKSNLSKPNKVFNLNNRSSFKVYDIYGRLLKNYTEFLFNDLKSDLKGLHIIKVESENFNETIKYYFE